MLLHLILLAVLAKHSATLSWTWTKGDGGAVTGFYVLRASDCTGPFAVIATLAKAKRSYTDKTVSGGASYCYEVEAYNASGASGPSNAPTNLKDVSQRELEVEYHLSRGLVEKDVAQVMGISPKTVSTHKSSLYRKRGVHTQTQLAIQYWMRQFAASIRMGDFYA